MMIPRDQKTGQVAKKFLGVVFLFACTLSVNGYAFNSERDLCIDSNEGFQIINHLRGSSRLGPKDYEDIADAARIIDSNEDERRSKFNLSADAKKFSDEVSTYAKKIVDISISKQDGEDKIVDISQQLRDLHRSCKGCHDYLGIRTNLY